MSMTEQMLDRLYAAGKKCLRARDRLGTGLNPSAGSEEAGECIDEAALACLETAAEAGHAVAAFKLSRLYADAHSRMYDKQKAMDLSRQALADMVKQVLANPSLAWDAGYAYLYESNPQDVPKAKQCFQVGADAGNASCVWQLGEIAKIEGQKVRAFQKFLEAAVLGQGMAMYAVAECYETGYGVPFDKGEAIRWYRRCAESSFAAHHDAEKKLQQLTTP